MTDKTEFNVDTELDKLFDDVTLDEVTGSTEAITEEETAPEEDNEPSEVEVEKESEEPAKEPETKQEEKPEKPSGVKNLREFGERQKARADELEGKLTEVNQKIAVIEEIGDVETVKNIVESFGGIEQAKAGVELTDIFKDTTSAPDVLIDRVRDYFPEVVDTVIAHVAETLAETVREQEMTALFGRELTADERVRVKDFVLYGETKGDELPEELTQDEFGNKLPDRVINLLKNARNTERKTLAQIQALETKLNGKFGQIETRAVEEARNQFTNDSFAVIGEKLDALGLLKPVPNETKEEAEARMDDAATLNDLTFSYFNRNTAASKAFDEATKLIGKTDKFSQSRLHDLRKTIAKHASVAAGRAAAKLAPSISRQTAEVKSQLGKQKITDVKQTAVGSRQTKSSSFDPFDDLTADNVLS